MKLLKPFKILKKENYTKLFKLTSVDIRKNQQNKSINISATYPDHYDI